MAKPDKPTIDFLRKIQTYLDEECCMASLDAEDVSYQIDEFIDNYQIADNTKRKSEFGTSGPSNCQCQSKNNSDDQAPNNNRNKLQWLKGEGPQTD